MVVLVESVAIYCRLSREDGDDAESNSIKTQKMIMENHCKKQGWTVYDTYVDDGYSGTNFDRPGFQRMYQDVINAKVNVVLSKDLSRLGRNYILTGYYYQVFFPEVGVRYIAVNDHIDTKNENSDMAMAAFKNIMNDLYSKSLSKSVVAAKNTRLENKINCFSTAPYGYRLDAGQRKYVIVPEYAQIIKHIFEEYIKVPNMSEIARQLNEQGIFSPGSYRLYSSENFKGNKSTKWSFNTLLSIITNPSYMGALSSGRRKKLNPYSIKLTRIPRSEQKLYYDCHEPIVTRKLWEEANELREKISRNKKNHFGKNLYSRKLFCAHCGKALQMHYCTKATCYCSCWPITEDKRLRYLRIESLNSFMLRKISEMALICEEDEEKAFSLISTSIRDPESRQKRIELNIEINQSRQNIRTLEENIEKLETYTATQNIPDKDTVLKALETSHVNEIKNLEKLQDSQTPQPSGNDIAKFIHLARSYGYIKVIDVEVLETLVDKLYIAHRDNCQYFHKDQVSVRYKYIGVLPDY